MVFLVQLLARIIDRVSSNLSEEEQRLERLGKDTLKVVKRRVLLPVEEYKDEWNEFNRMAAMFRRGLKEYSGSRRAYFESILQRIGEEERQALGYHL